MVDAKVVEDQLKSIGFKTYGWGRTEVKELPHIILPDEEIFECVNGIYEGGFALLVATDLRTLLVDKKPLNYLTVEDMRYDLISEIDYSHRILGAFISISSGEKNLKFRSYNQQRLRKLISHVQHCIAEIKKKASTHQEGQNHHLEEINQQLQAYLVAQYEQQQKMHEQLEKVNTNQLTSIKMPELPELVRPTPELADYLYAQSLLAQHQLQNGQTSQSPAATAARLSVATTAAPSSSKASAPSPSLQPAEDQSSDLYDDGMKEIYGKHLHRRRLGGLATSKR